MDDSSSVKNVNKITYRRRLDRTPDKQFEQLPYTDKVAVSSLRKALEEAKFRIIKLRDENDEKECIIDEEKMLRKATEDKLQKLLVDLYNSPEVNIELQNRLPKAKKNKSHELISENEATPDSETSLKSSYGHQVNHGLSDHLIHIADGEFPPLHDKLSVNHLLTRHDGAQRFHLSSESLSSQIIPGISLTQTLGSVSASSLSSMESSSYQALPSYGGTVSDSRNYKDSSSQYNLPSLITTKEMPVTMMSVPNGDDNRAVHWNLNPPLHGQPSASHHLPPMSNTQPVWNGQVTSQFQNRVEPAGDQFTMNQSHNPVATRYESLVNKYTDPVTPYPGQLSYNPASLPSSKQHPLVTPSGSHDNPSLPNGTLVNPKNISSYRSDHLGETYSYPPLYTSGTPFPDNGFPVSSFSTSAHPNPSYVPDSSSAFHVPPSLANFTTSNGQSFKSYPPESVQVSHMTRLLAEISTLKKENNELREELKKVKQEKEMLGKESKTENKDNFETVGALIESVRAEEKKHNEAAKLLVQAADEDKLAALKKLDRITLSNKLRRTLSESDLSEADSFVSTRSEPKRRLSKSSDSSQVPLEHLVRRQREIMKEEMQRVIDQRNEARQKVTKLEKKLSNMKMTKSSESKNDLLMARLKVMEEERDLLLAKFHFVMQDIGETKLVYNLHKALLSDDPANDMNTYHSSRDSLADNNVVNNKVKAKLARESEDRSNLETKLAILQKENLAQAECIEKLQQLIQRQRHKLNTLCAGPMLLE